MCKGIRKTCIFHGFMDMHISSYHIYICYISCHIYIIHTKTFLASVKREACCQCHSKSYKKRKHPASQQSRGQAVVFNVTQLDTAWQHASKVRTTYSLQAEAQLSYCFWIRWCVFLASGKKPGNHQSYGDGTRDFLIMNPKISIGNKTPQKWLF